MAEQQSMTIKHADRDFVRVGQSLIQGKGLFAKRKIPKGARIIEYTGERVPLAQLQVEIAEGKPASVYMFCLTESTAIDGARNGNQARFINHSCEPNCEAYLFDAQMYIYAMREIVRGEELGFDYQLTPAIKGTKKKENTEAYACRCGSLNCRGTMLSQKKNSQIKS